MRRCNGTFAAEVSLNSRARRAWTKALGWACSPSDGELGLATLRRSPASLVRPREERPELSGTKKVGLRYSGMVRAPGLQFTPMSSGEKNFALSLTTVHAKEAIEELSIATWQPLDLALYSDASAQVSLLGS
ncbi:hypothetical protein Trco_007230 [Trichoderma cornu-damae]|uniref:Uncharacterized protein n=1 Tax=Trichoderma cornu-damae TaxID=654480 RepID=A0A9P8TSX4_9HYPO|nr:hypothetical protein Trco_007230 [Trichoderma cornu-damae]